MTEWWKVLTMGSRLSLSLMGMLVFLLVMHIMVWRGMEVSIDEVHQEVGRLDEESQGLLQKITTLKSIERDIIELRKILASRVQQFSENKEITTFRRDVVEIAKRRKVIVRVWKPEVPIQGLLHLETAIPITVRVEGNFQNTVEFLDEMRQLSWVQTIASFIMSRKQGSEDSPIIITNFSIHGLTPSGIEHVQRLLEA